MCSLSPAPHGRWDAWSFVDPHQNCHATQRAEVFPAHRADTVASQGTCALGTGRWRVHAVSGCLRVTVKTRPEVSRCSESPRLYFSITIWVGVDIPLQAVTCPLSARIVVLRRGRFGGRLPQTSQALAAAALNTAAGLSCYWSIPVVCACSLHTTSVTDLQRLQRCWQDSHAATPDPQLPRFLHLPTQPPALIQP